MLNDWLAHTPKSVLAKNLGVDESILNNIPGGDVFGIAPTAVSTALVPDPYGQLQGNSSYVYKLSQKPAGEVPGRGGTLAIVDSRNFPVAKNIASAVVTLDPNGLRELHWHPNVRSLLSLPSIPLLHTSSANDHPGSRVGVFHPWPRPCNSVHWGWQRQNV